MTDFTITGRLAQFGRGGMMQDVSNRLLRDFATCLSTRLVERAGRGAPSGAEVAAGEAPPEAVAAAASTAAAGSASRRSDLKRGSLFFSVLWERIKRAVRSSRPTADQSALTGCADAEARLARADAADCASVIRASTRHARELPARRSRPASDRAASSG